MTKNLKFFILYLLLVVLAYWQISFFQYALKWDMIDCYLPWRSYVSECLLNFHFPLWNPYQDYGYPIHADMRTIWSPEIWLVSLLGGYSVYTFSILFVIYSAIAGLSMKLLANELIKNDNAAFYTGLVYMLAGYLTDHAQELSTINSFAYIPLVLYLYIKFGSKPSIKNGLFFVLSIFLLVTSGYQAHSFILLYLLIVLFISYTIKLYCNKQYKKIWQFFLYHFAFVIIITIIFIPVIISAYQVLPWVSRLNSGVNPATISILSFTPQSLISLILPFAVIRNAEFFDTSLSMTNLYFGILPLAFLLVYLFKIKRKNQFNIFLFFGIISLIISFGAYTPLRKILFDYAPFMNLFIGSAYFRLFALIAFSIASGFIFINIKAYKKEILIACYFILSILIFFLIHSILNTDFEQFSFHKREFGFVDLLASKSSYFENIFIQAIIQIIFLIVFIVLLLKNKGHYKAIYILTILNLIIAIQLNINSTAVSKHSPKKIDNFLSKQPLGFPIPDALLISECTDRSMSNSPLWRNTNMLAKRVSGDAFNSFRLDKTKIFKDSLAILEDSVVSNELLYFSNDIKPLSDIKKAHFNSKTLFISDSIYNVYKAYKSTQNILNNTYKIKSFEPNKIEVNVDAEKGSFLTIIQSKYLGWNIYLDDTPAEIIESNTMFISVHVPKGKHKINYVYKNNTLIIGFVISAITLIIALIFALYYINFKKTYYIALVIPLILIIHGQNKYRSWEKKFDSAIEIYSDLTTPCLINDTLKTNPDNSYKVNVSDNNDLTILHQFLESNQSDTFIFTYKNRYIQPEFEQLINLYFKTSETILDQKRSKIIMAYNKSKTKPLFFNNFENSSLIDQNNYNSYDSTINHFLACKNKEYISSYQLKLNKNDLKKSIVGIVNVSIKPEIKRDDILFVMSFKKNNKTVHWARTRFVDFYNNSNTTSTFMHALDLSYLKIPNNTTVKIYIWNRNKVDFKIDNYKIYLH